MIRAGDQSFIFWVVWFYAWEGLNRIPFMRVSMVVYVVSPRSSCVICHMWNVYGEIRFHQFYVPEKSSIFSDEIFANELFVYSF